MKHSLLLLFALLASQSVLFAQTAPAVTDAVKIIQPSQAAPVSTTPATSDLKIPAGTPVEVEVAYTVNSLDVKAGERISFRVLVPIVIDGVKVIERGALVTARITQAKRGGHWGKAGKLVWNMEDVVAADNSRVPLDPGTSSSGDKLWSLEVQNTKSETGSVTGTSHVGEVATKTIIAGAIFPPLAPLALIHGFKRGENAILREGRRFVVAVGKDTLVKTTAVSTP